MESISDVPHCISVTHELNVLTKPNPIMDNIFSIMHKDSKVPIRFDVNTS